MRDALYSHHNCETSVKKVTQSFHFDGPFTQVANSPYFIGASGYAIIFIYLGLGLSSYIYVYIFF